MQRVEVEELLKKGEIPCLVATSSLELGIDMGAVDLVIQVESPKSVARGLQRVGRAGHRLDEASKGRIFPKFRADLLESAVVVKRMKEGLIEETKVPRNPLDVLAQQIVAVCAQEEIAVDDLHDLARRAWPFRDLTRQQLENVLDMLAGRYPSEEFAELRPRITWDRVAGLLRGREGARRLAVTNAGTIPDRGLFGVHLVDGGGRVGELDEEMVYEARAGQTFLLGASTWRIEEITRDRVLVSPAPGAPGSSLLEGEGVGRPYELGAAIGRTARELLGLDDERARGRLVSEHELDERAAGNLLTFLREQEQATGVLPSDRAVVVERFRDEIGDWRVCILTPFGARVHAPGRWRSRPPARVARSRGQLHLVGRRRGAPPARRRRAASTRRAARGAGRARRPRRRRARRHGALRRALPRERRPRAPDPAAPAGSAHAALATAPEGAGPAPGRTPLSRLSGGAGDLPRGAPGRLRPARPAPLLDALRQRRIDLVDVETPSASPFASSLLFDYVATYMYEDDTPLAERRAQALALDRDLLKELLGQEELRELIDPAALEQVERELLGSPAAVDALHDLLLRRGDLAPGEFDDVLAVPLEAERRAVRIRVGGAERLIAAEDAGRYRDALGAMPPSGLPDAYLDGGEDPLGWILRRFARPRPLHHRRSRPALRARAGAGRGGSLRSRPRPRRAATRRIRARVVRPRRPQARPPASLARLRKEVEPVDQGALGRFLPGWQGVDRRATLREALVALQGLSLPVALWESDVPASRARLPARLARPADGVRRGRVGGGGARASRSLLPGRRPRPRAPGRSRLRRGGAQGHPRGALVRGDVLVRPPRRPASRRVLPALWDLVWAGEVTNDAWQPLRAPPVPGAEA